MNLNQRNPMSALDYQQQALSFQPEPQLLAPAMASGARWRWPRRAVAPSSC
jgi:hypothetical protein